MYSQLYLEHSFRGIRYTHIYNNVSVRRGKQVIKVSAFQNEILLTETNVVYIHLACFI